MKKFILAGLGFLATAGMFLASPAFAGYCPPVRPQVRLYTPYHPPVRHYTRRHVQRDCCHARTKVIYRDRVVVKRVPVPVVVHDNPCNTCGAVAAPPPPPCGTCSGNRWAAVTACLSQLGVAPGEVSSQLGPDGHHHAILTWPAKNRLESSGLLGQAAACTRG